MASAAITAGIAAQKFEAAVGAIRRNQLEEARRLLTQTIQADSSHADAHATMGALLLDQGESDLAHEVLIRAISLAPGNARIHLLASVALERVGKTLDAIREALSASSLEPTWPEVQRQLGRLYGRTGNRSACTQSWRNLVELTGYDDHEALSALGMSLSNDGQHDDAIKILSRVASSRQNDAAAIADLGMAELVAGRLEQARQTFAYAAKVSIGCAQAHVGLGMAFAHERKWQEAARELRIAVRLAPSSEVAHYDLGLAFEALGDHEQARLAFLRAAALAPNDAEIAAALNRVLGLNNRSAHLTDPSNSITGDMQRFPLTNLLEFLRMQTKTGTLTVATPLGVGVVKLHEGRLVSASSPRAKRLGEMLLEGGLITRDQFERALFEQTSLATDVDALSYFGAIVLSHGWLTKERLGEVVFDQIITALNEILSWEQGMFSFQIMEGQTERPALTFDLQYTILELFRRRDEVRDRAALEARPGLARNPR